jgi:prepilin-type N-terminal cleavage/methylation domain-containing protein
MRLLRPFRRRGPGSRARRRESGYTLIEMLVAMGLMSVLIGIFMAGIVQMTKSAVRVQNVNNSTDEVRRAFDRMDRQLRYASAVNTPGQTGSDWYVEFLTTATGTATGQCTLWRLVNSTHRLQYRTWVPASATASTWITVASNVVNDPTTQPPFTLTPANNTYTRQQVALYLKVSNGQPGGAEVSASFIARNSSTASNVAPCLGTIGRP